MIWKFPLALTLEQLIDVPANARFLHAGLDPSGTPCVWALVALDVQRVAQTIFVVGTGEPVPERPLVHLDSFVHGPFVWHVFVASVEDGQ